MAWYEIFKREQPTTASVAKDRLQIIIARERRTLGRDADGEGRIAKLQQELLAVISKYEGVDLDQVSVKVDKCGNGEVLELNILLPEDELPDSDRLRTRAAFA
ncbi:MAG: cell division topological specificity factor MinE [Myxococcales bacterium]|nr:cell division topological specificity factor MinE [Myxococcales bacterium]